MDPGSHTASVDATYTSALFWILVGIVFVAAELAMTILIVWRCAKPTREHGRRRLKQQ
jgi:hypothetical protein